MLSTLRLLTYNADEGLRQSLSATGQCLLCHPYLQQLDGTQKKEMAGRDFLVPPSRKGLPLTFHWSHLVTRPQLTAKLLGSIVFLVPRRRSQVLILKSNATVDRMY